MKKSICFLVCFLHVICMHAQAPAFDWAKQFGADSTDGSFSVTTDVSGNLYIAGFYSGTADFDPGPSSYNLTSHGNIDAFVCKLDPAGDLVWARSWGGAGMDDAENVAVDGSGNVYLNGVFEDTVDFDPGSDTAFAHCDFICSYISKFDSVGNFLWMKVFENTSLGFGGVSLTLDSTYLYMTGTFYDSADFDPGAAVYDLITDGWMDSFILKLDANGALVWAKQIGGPGQEGAFAMSVDPHHNILITGEFIGTSDFDPGPATFTFSSPSKNNIFILKLDQGGDFVWARHMNGNENDEGLAISSDNYGNVYTSGSYGGTTDFDPGFGTYNFIANSLASDIFISKLDGSGNFVWAKSIGGNDNDLAWHITSDPSNSIYLTGSFSGKVDFDPGPGTDSLLSNGASDIFILKLDSTGNYSWSMNLGGSGYDGGIAMTLNGTSIFVTGGFENTCDFNFGSGVNTLTCNGSSDGFLLKMGQSATGISESENINGFIVYPNPAINSLNIKCNEENYSISIYDNLGKLTLKKSKLDNNSDMDISSLSDGFYTIVLEGRKDKREQKFIKQ